ncbi:hypothetical protein HDV62DRAFT_44923 [Trichoderma sp. SZMC 28011]
MACQNPVCRECGSSKGLSHDRPSLRRQMLSHRTKHVRVTTELGVSCTVRVREEAALSVCPNEPQARHPARTPPGAASCLLGLASGSPSAKRETVILRRISLCPQHVYCEQGRLVAQDQERRRPVPGPTSTAPHRTAQATWQICQPALDHLTSKLCALTCACKHASLHIKSRTSTETRPKRPPSGTGLKVTCQTRAATRGERPSPL